MKKYQSFKVVEASKIKGITRDSVTLVHTEDETIAVSYSWDYRHQPQPGGYFVRYEDGYESYSPAEAFESGYRELS